jgi:hypothetical protein
MLTVCFHFPSVNKCTYIYSWVFFSSLDVAHSFYERLGSGKDVLQDLLTVMWINSTLISPLSMLPSGVLTVSYGFAVSYGSGYTVVCSYIDWHNEIS